eukprot:gene6065-6767_t
MAADMCRISQRVLFLRYSINTSLPGLRKKCRTSFLSTEAVANVDTPIYRKPWRVFVAVLLERKPIVSKAKNDIEMKFDDFQRKLEFEQSALSDYEFMKNKIKKSSVTGKKKLTEAEEQKRIEAEREFARLEDEEKSVQEEVENLKLQNRLTPDDETNNLMSLNRNLDKSLHLVLKNETKWLLPEAEIAEGENLRQAAERILRDQYNTDIPALFLSNAPSGVYTEEIDSKDKVKSDYQGRKVFFYKAMLQMGRNDLPSLKNEFKWLTINEMYKTIPTEYFKQVSKFI